MADTKKGKPFVLTIQPELISGAEVMKSGDYKNARMYAKLSDDEFVNVNFEWRGENIPESVFAMMSYIQSSKNVVEIAGENASKELADFKDRLLKNK